MDWINVAFGKNKCGAAVRMILKFRDIFNTGNFLNAQAAIIFPRITTCCTFVRLKTNFEFDVNQNF